MVVFYYYMVFHYYMVVFRYYMVVFRLSDVKVRSKIHVGVDLGGGVRGLGKNPGDRKNCFKIRKGNKACAVHCTVTLARIPWY